MMNKGLTGFLSLNGSHEAPLDTNAIEVLDADLNDVAGGWCIGFSCGTYETQTPKFNEAE